jgi:Flp pilus assembly protein TadD
MFYTLTYVVAAAGAFEATGRLPEARLAADRAIALDPDDERFWSLGARILDRLGDVGLAERYRAAARAITGGGAPVVSERTPTQPLGDLRGEVDALYRMVQSRPAWTLAYRDRATVMRLLGEYDRALYYLDLVARDLVDGPHPAVLTERGGLLAALGREEEAQTAFREALDLDAGFAPARVALERLTTPTPSTRTAVADSGTAPSKEAAPQAPPPIAYCVGCGGVLPDDADFCPDCGTRRVR